MDFIRLRRKTIIDNETPLIVIDTLCSMNGIRDNLDISEKISKLNDDKNYKTISSRGTEWKDKDWEYIARFINPNVTWNPKNLYRAFLSVLSNQPHRVYGERNNYTPEIGDIIDAYNMCRKLNILLKKNTSYNEMTNSLIFAQMPEEYFFLLNTNIPKLLILEAFYENDLSIIKHQEIPGEENTINIPPKTETDAFFSALKNKQDLSLADCKLVEHYRSSENFICDRLQQISDSNPYRLRVGHYFNPRIPYGYYDEQQINEMSSMEGISGNAFSKYQNLLELSYLNNFHHLLQPEVSQTESLYTKESFGEINKLLIVSYGVLSFFPSEFEKNTMSAYTIPELIHMFKSKKSFVNFFTEERFPDHAINKLERICRGLLHNSKVDTDIKNLCTDLLQTIEINREIERNDCSEVQKWVSEIKEKNMIKETVSCLQTMTKAGFYMRKWDGGSNLPIRDVSSEELTDEEEDKVYAEIEKFEKMDQILGEIVSKLPLYKHEYGNFQVVIDKFEGLSIGERLNIVKKGNTISEMSSCIKCSSNLIITSGYYYLLMLDEPIKAFHIKDLRYVSE